MRLNRSTTATLLFVFGFLLFAMPPLGMADDKEPDTHYGKKHFFTKDGTFNKAVVRLYHKALGKRYRTAASANAILGVIKVARQNAEVKPEKVILPMVKGKKQQIKDFAYFMLARYYLDREAPEKALKYYEKVMEANLKG